MEVNLGANPETEIRRRSNVDPKNMGCGVMPACVHIQFLDLQIVSMETRCLFSETRSQPCLAT